MSGFNKVIDKLEEGKITVDEAIHLINNAKLSVKKGKAHWVSVHIVSSDFKFPFPLKFPLFIGNLGVRIARHVNKDAKKQLEGVDLRPIMHCIKHEMKGVSIVDVVSQDANVKISFS